MHEAPVSIIVPVHHGGVFLERLLTSLQRLDWPPNRLEVVFALPEPHAAERGGLDAAEAPFSIRCVDVSSTRRAVALNAALHVARGEWLAFTDDDCILPADWLRRLQAAFAAPGVGWVGGSDRLAVETASAFDIALDVALRSFWGTGGIPGGGRLRLGAYCPRLWNMAIRRAALDRLADNGAGPFVDTLDVHEDVVLAQQLRDKGLEPLFDSSLAVDHHRDTTFRSFVRINRDMAGTSYRRRVHGAAHTMLLGYFLLLGLSVVLAAAVPATGVVPLVVAAPYLFALAAVGVEGLWRYRRMTALILSPLLVLSMHLARTAGYAAAMARETARRQGRE